MGAADILLKVLDVANPLAGIAATFLAGKLGMTDKSIDAVQQVVSGMSGGDQVKLRQIAADLQDHIAQYGVQLQIADLQAQAATVGAVNATLQADARGSGWLQANHHAIESLATVAMVIAIYFGLPAAHIAPPIVPSEAFFMLGGILGVTAWQRGEVKKIQAGN